MTQFGVLFVCTGNICRSPTAHAVFLRRVREAGLEARVRVDSAGTHDYHAGESPDERAQEHARRRGYDLSGLRARKVTRGDFERFDLILALDRGHLRVLERLAGPDERAKLHLLMDFARGTDGPDVPDPYYGGDDGFNRVLDMIEDAAGGLIEEVRARL